MYVKDNEEIYKCRKRDKNKMLCEVRGEEDCFQLRNPEDSMEI